MKRSLTRDKAQPDPQFRPQRTQSVSNKKPNNNNRQMYKSREPSSSRKASQSFYSAPVVHDLTVNYKVESSLKSLPTYEIVPTAKSKFF